MGGNVQLIDGIANQLYGSICELNLGFQLRMNPKMSRRARRVNKPVVVKFAKYPAMGAFPKPLIFERYI